MNIPATHVHVFYKNWTRYTYVSSLGIDLSKWDTEQKYVSWLNLCPKQKNINYHTIGTGPLSL